MKKYLNLRGLSAVEISGELNSVSGDNAPSDATIYRWIAEFQRGRKSTEDEHRSGRPEKKQVRLATSRDNLSLYNADPAKFLRRYVTMDETWAHHFDPETQQQSKQWKYVTSSTPVKFCKIASAGKVMASVF